MQHAAAVARLGALNDLLLMTPFGRVEGRDWWAALTHADSPVDAVFTPPAALAAMTDPATRDMAVLADWLAFAHALVLRGGPECPARAYDVMHVLAFLLIQLAAAHDDGAPLVEVEYEGRMLRALAAMRNVEDPGRQVPCVAHVLRTEHTIFAYDARRNVIDATRFSPMFERPAPLSQ